MIPDSQIRWEYTRAAYWILGACSVAYVIVSLFSPSPTASHLYHLSDVQRILLQLTIVVPMIIIWFIGLWGAVAFREYAAFIRTSRESQGLWLISTGLLWLIGYLVTLNLTNVILPYFIGSTALPILVSVKNHLPALTSLIAFALICRGSLRLRRSTPYSVWTPGAFILLGVIAVLASVFARLFLETPATLTTAGVPSQTLPREILVFTMVLPYCWAWFMGLLAALNIAKYARHVKGIIYRQALGNLTWGVAAAVSMVALVQCLTLTNRFLTQLKLGTLLLVIYGLLIICAVGFWFVRRGAQKLLRIEIVQ
jgi:hypothetical protein